MVGTCGKRNLCVCSVCDWCVWGVGCWCWTCVAAWTGRRVPTTTAPAMRVQRRMRRRFDSCCTRHWVDGMRQRPTGAARGPPSRWAYRWAKHHATPLEHHISFQDSTRVSRVKTFSTPTNPSLSLSVVGGLCALRGSAALALPAPSPRAPPRWVQPLLPLPVLPPLPHPPRLSLTPPDRGPASPLPPRARLPALSPRALAPRLHLPLPDAAAHAIASAAAGRGPARFHHAAVQPGLPAPVPLVPGVWVSDQVA